MLHQNAPSEKAHEKQRDFLKLLQTQNSSSEVTALSKLYENPSLRLSICTHSHNSETFVSSYCGEGGGNKGKPHAIVQFDSAIHLIYMELEHYTTKLFSYQRLRTANTSKTHSPKGEIPFLKILSLPHTAQKFSRIQLKAVTSSSDPTPQVDRINARIPVLMKQGKPKLMSFINLTLSCQSFCR